MSTRPASPVALQPALARPVARSARPRALRLTRRTVNYLFLSLVAFIMAFPFLWMLSTTFKSTNAIFALPPALLPDKLFQPDMFSAYSVLFSEHNFLRYTYNSFYVSLLASVGQLITSSLAGFAFARLEFRGKKLLFGLLLATAIVPIEVTIIPEFLLALRVFEPIMNMLGGQWMDTYSPLIIPSFFVGTTGTFLLREFFSTVPRDLEEAAMLDGAGVFQVYRHVYLPLSIPAMTTLFLLAFIANWNALLRPVIYINDPDLRTLPLGLTTFQGQYTSEWDLLLAGSVLTILPLIAVYIFAQRYIVDGIATTGLKG